VACFYNFKEIDLPNNHQESLPEAFGLDFSKIVICCVNGVLTCITAGATLITLDNN
jgi:hypothetical protein